MWHHNVDLLAYHDLDGRSGFKLALQEVDGRFFLYVAGFWHSGWSILDVTDPEHPELLRFLDGPPNTMTIQVRVAETIMTSAPASAARAGRAWSAGLASTCQLPPGPLGGERYGCTLGARIARGRNSLADVLPTEPERPACASRAGRRLAGTNPQLTSPRSRRVRIARSHTRGG
jgi:hypothetical protein